MKTIQVVFDEQTGQFQYGGQGISGKEELGAILATLIGVLFQEQAQANAEKPQSKILLPGQLPQIPMRGRH